MDFVKDGLTRLTAPINEHNTAFLEGKTTGNTETAQITNILPKNLTLWHCRFGHYHNTRIENLMKHNLARLKLVPKNSEHQQICEPCLAGKMNAKPFKQSKHHTSAPLELVHSDVHYAAHATFTGFKYWITFIDDFSRFRIVIPLQAKSDTFEAFKHYKAYAENCLDQKIKALRDDKGGEYMSSEFIRFTTECGIICQHMVQNHPQQNSVAEHANRFLMEHISTMLNESGMAKNFWGECLAALTHVWNRCSGEATKNTTPYQAWHGQIPDVSHLRAWGCTAYMHIQKDKCSPLGSHMEKCVFIGYPEGYKGWKFYIPSTRRTIISERAEFDEEHFPMRNEPNPKSTTNSNEGMECNNAEPEEEQPSNNSGEPEQGEELPMPESEINPIDDSTADPPSTEPIGIGARLPTRSRQAPRQWCKPWEPQQSNATCEPHGEPRSYAEAIQ